MRYLISVLLLLFTATSFAQKEFHVFPKDGETIQGTKEGDGSLTDPWDLQTALSQSSERVNGGDIIWLHKGVYTGRYRSKIESTIINKYITVSAYKDHKVILNGNKGRKISYVLEVAGAGVIYKNFEITYLGEYSRNKKDSNFFPGVGINHTRGNCKFQNLIIHNIPGSAIGSWKAAGGSVIEDCIIYNNGYQGDRGHGVGIYIQNQSENVRLIRNNIIFNNYYKGIEAWSATSGSKKEFVKNITISNNIIFNNGSPSGKHVDNIIIASKDSDGINVAKRIKILNNILYHNVDFLDTINHGHGAALTLGYNRNSPVEDITISNNMMIGKNNPLNFTFVKSTAFNNNIIYGGYMHYHPTLLPSLRSGIISLNANRYYTRELAGLRVLSHKNYTIDAWQDTFNVDKNSQLKLLKDFKIKPVLKVLPLTTNPNHFNIALLDKTASDVTVDFSDFKIEKGTTYKIYDIENKTEVIVSGKLGRAKTITFPMKLEKFEMPLHNTIAVKSENNFGVFRVEFEAKEKKKGFFNRLFGWLF